MTIAAAEQTQSYGARGGGGGGSASLYDVLELILDRGLVIDVFARVSLVGIEILKVDVRIVVASVDTYLRFAEACNRLDLESGPNKSASLPELVGDMQESGARHKTKGAIGGAAQSVTDSLRQVREDASAKLEEMRPKSRRTTASRGKAEKEDEKEAGE
jgi:hypothetical protein